MDVAEGIITIVQEIQNKLPNAHVIVLVNFVKNPNGVNFKTVVSH